jgi:hypothetical protein
LSLGPLIFLSGGLWWITTWAIGFN